jgi:hypothetical protein
VPATGAPVATNGDQQGRRSPAQRLVGQLSGHGVARYAFAAAASTPLVGLEDLARQDRATGFEALAGDDEAELVESAEGGQIGASERICTLADGSVGHVEVSQMGS